MTSLRLFFVGLVASALTILAPFVLAFFIPGMAIVTSGKNDVPNISSGDIYSREELEKFEREMKERVNKPGKDARNKSLAEISSYLRLSFWWSSWLPWLLLPFLTKLRPRSLEVVIPLLPVLFIVLLGWVLPIEAILAVVSLFLGILVKSKRM